MSRTRVQKSNKDKKKMTCRKTNVLYALKITKKTKEKRNVFLYLLSCYVCLSTYNQLRQLQLPLPLPLFIRTKNHKTKDSHCCTGRVLLVRVVLRDDDAYRHERLRADCRRPPGSRDGLRELLEPLCLFHFTHACPYILDRRFAHETPPFLLILICEWRVFHPQVAVVVVAFVISTTL